MVKFIDFRKVWQESNSEEEKLKLIEIYTSKCSHQIGIKLSDKTKCVFCGFIKDKFDNEVDMQAYKDDLKFKDKLKFEIARGYLKEYFVINPNSSFSDATLSANKHFQNENKEYIVFKKEMEKRFYLSNYK